MLALGIAVLGTAVLATAARAQSAAPQSASQQSAAPATPQPILFSAAQRTEIVGILRAALKTDPSILRDAIVALRQDERESQQAAARVAIGRSDRALSRDAGDPAAGPADADVTLVEFYDLRCPYCRQMLPVLTELMRADPRLRVVYKDIPVLGPPSALGARAVLAAQRQGGYARLREAIMTGPAQITEASLKVAAAQAGLDWDRLHRDMADPAIQARLDANLDLAHQLGIDGTPAYVVGRKLLPGAVSLGELQQAIAAARAG